MLNLQNGRVGNPAADPETSVSYAFLSQVVIVNICFETTPWEGKSKSLFQQPERGGEEGEGGSDEESQIDAQDGRPGGEQRL